MSNGAAEQRMDPNVVPIMEKTRFTPTYRRSHVTKKSVLIADKVADIGISVGGILVIVAVFGIMVFLAQVAVPLFAGAHAEKPVSFDLAPAQRLWFANIDEYRTMGVRLIDNGRIETFHAPTGKPLTAKTLDVGGRKVSGIGVTLKRNTVAVGFDDGSVGFAKWALKAEVLTPESRPKNLSKLTDLDATDGTAVFSAITGSQYRKIYPEISLDEPKKVAEEAAAIIALDVRTGETVERPTRSLVTLDRNGVIRLSRTETQVNLFTGMSGTSISTTTLPPLPAGARPFRVLMTTPGDQVYAAERSGKIYRYDVRDVEKPVLAEVADLSNGKTEITSITFLIGEATLVVGLSDGAVHNYFRLQLKDAGTKDGYKLVRGRVLEPHGGAVVAINPSQRDKSLVTVDASGEVWFRHATSEQVLLRLKGPDSLPEANVVLSPRANGILLTDPSGKSRLWHVDVPHPETTWRSIFGKVWYEGYPEPTYTWQSSSGTDTFEPKLSLIPLIFGTIKATIYSLLFAVPISLFAAIYTSEFVHRRVRAAVKPMMEMMESLPTVVLGFVAALILAPIVESWVAAVILALFVLPLSFAAAAYLWQLLPHDLALRLQGVPKFAIMLALVGLASYAAYRLGPPFERLFFYGDLKAWANGAIGTGLPFTSLILFPLALVAVTMAFNRTVGGRFREWRRDQERFRAAAGIGLRWLGLLIAAAMLAFAVAGLLTALGFDPRGGIVDTYVQRNALVVGFVMGFAVIPNIYTLAEDALNAVPPHLRAGSLATGATPWQTAIWVVLPTAMSGVFAAVMIGMGRAVGETMIVVMAAGNTPVLDWNIFNGLRTLSANIAVELPESVQDGTLYRTLFLAALTLFIMTFVINTAAEIIRQRFRKRAFEL